MSRYFGNGQFQLNKDADTFGFKVPFLFIHEECLCEAY